MHENTHTGYFTTISAVAGGISKVLITDRVLLNVSCNGLFSVMTYAAASAVVGYVVKISLDFGTRYFIKKWVSPKEDTHE